MSEKLDSIFPEINNPTWISDREECWELALTEGDWKKEYRKKDLEKIRHYFFTGEVLDGLAIQKYSGYMLDLFPIQTTAGYDYYYKNHDFTAEQLESNFQSAFLDQKIAGMRWKEQKAYFDYHVGSTFESLKTFKGKNIGVDAIVQFKQISVYISGFLQGENYIQHEKLAHLIPYFLSLIEFIFREENGFKSVKSKVLPKLIVRIEGDEYLRSGDDLESIRKKIMSLVKLAYIKIKDDINS